MPWARGQGGGGATADLPPPPTSPARRLHSQRAYCRIRQQEAELSRRAAAYQTLLAEHELLAAQKAEDDCESVEATAFFREELLAKNAEVEALQVR